MEFSVGDYVFLKVSTMRVVTRFGIKEKLALRYVGPFKIVDRIGDTLIIYIIIPHVCLSDLSIFDVF